MRPTLCPAASRFFSALHKFRKPTTCRSQASIAMIKVLGSSQSANAVSRSTRTYLTTRPNLAQSQTNAQTYYDIFPNTIPSGPPPNGPFQVDLAKLRREFLQLQSRVHPDKFPTGPDKARAEGASANINEAYKTLQDPLLRAQYLLGLRGIDTAEDETAKTEDPELLMKVMEVREEMEDAGQESDLEGLKTDNNESIKLEERKLAEAMEKDDMDAAKEAAVRLRYWVNIKGSLDMWEKGKPVVMHH